MTLSEALDVAQTAFLLSSAGVVLVGGLVALWRMVGQHPFGVEWQAEGAAEGRVKLGENGTYEYIFGAQMRNMSVSAQKCTRRWDRLSFPGEVSYGAGVVDVGSAEEATHYLGEPVHYIRDVPSGGEMAIVAFETRDRLYHVFDAAFALEVETSGFLGHFKRKGLKTGWFRVPVNTDDIALYQK